MPCTCDEYLIQFMKSHADSTRAACDLLTVLRRGGDESEVSNETRHWIAEHDFENDNNFEKEQIDVEQLLPESVLDKLSQDERLALRRALGL